MFLKIKESIKRDKDYPLRQFVLSVYGKVLDGTIYDNLPHYFYEEEDNGKPIPIIKRRPCVKYRLCKIVVDDSISLLFGDAHFPAIETKDDNLRETLEKIIDSAHISKCMLTAAKIGSVGSVALFLKICNGYLNITPMSTEFLTPLFSPSLPGIVIGMIEKYKVDGKTLIDDGYSIAQIDTDKVYWMVREWTNLDEIIYQPFTEEERQKEDFLIQPDEKRSTHHGLGFVPFVWIKNLPSTEEFDGECTFAAAIDNNIEIDYQLSQLGRCLRYSSDPLLIITGDDAPLEGQINKSANNALSLGKDGDAKYAEINGRSADAVLEYVERLRKIALENIHGNRTNPEKIAMAQSGRAIELLYQPLVWLTDNLRVTYGEGLLRLLEMIIAVSHVYAINISNTINPFVTQKTEIIKDLKIDEPIALRWPSWFATTINDKLQQAQSLKTLNEGGLISRETAVKVISNDYDIQNVTEEINQINKERQEMQKELAALKPQVKENVSLN